MTDCHQMKVVLCPVHGGWVPIVRTRPWSDAPRMRGWLEVAKHSTGPEEEIAPGYVRRLPCYGSGRPIDQDSKVATITYCQPDPEPGP